MISMRHIKYIVGMMVSFLMAFQTFSKGDELVMSSSIISSQELPTEFDSTRTFHYAFLLANPESLLTELWKANVRVSRAWLPLDNMCMGPIGPLFTVELEGEASAIPAFDFSQGEGRLHCATRLKQFVISD
jgi:hypothetical protein